MEKNLKIAVVGLGFIGLSHIEAIVKLENCQLCAVVDIDEKAGKQLSAKYGVPYFATMQELFASCECDAVDICLPTWLHEEYIISAANNKKHIICEKPITFSLESYDRIVCAVEKADVKFMVAQVIRFWPEYMKIKKLYDRGAFGEIKQATLLRLCEVPNWAEWFKDPAKSGGALYDLMVHDIDFAQYLFGDVQSVYASGSKNETGCWNYISANIKFANGINANIESCNNAFGGFPYSMGMRIFGSEMIAKYRMGAGHNIDNTAQRSLYTYSKNGVPEKQHIELYDAYQKEIEYFAGCVIKNVKCEAVTIESSRKTLQLVLAIKKSLEDGNIQYF